MGYKIFSAVIIVASLASNAFLYLKYTKDISEKDNEIWVVGEDGRPYKANKALTFNYEGRDFELEQEVREFYARGYSYDKDDFHVNVDGALALLGHSRDEFKSWVDDQGIEDQLVQNNWVFKAKVDSVLWDWDSKPVRLVVFGKQKISTKRKIILRNMHTSFSIMNRKSRTYDNSFGAELDEWDIFNSTVISETRRK